MLRKISRRTSLARQLLAVETLERRLPLAADISFNAQTRVLAIQGDAWDDYAFVDFSGSTANVTLVSQDAAGQWRQLLYSRPINGISRVEFAAGNGDNTMELTQGTLARGVSLANKQVHFFGGNHVDEFTNSTSIPSVARGGYGDDILRGGSGADSLYGEGDRDELFGNLGADILDGGDGIDHLYGGAGNDTLFGGNGVNWLHGEGDNDTLIGGESVDFLYGGYGHDVLEGRGGDDQLDGGHGDDSLYGGADHDTLVGGHGFDRLFGGDGEDVLNGGYDESLDYLEGGAGADKFQNVYRRWLAGNWVVLQIDTIGDLQANDSLEHQNV